jgi:hypothetical protein
MKTVAAQCVDRDIHVVCTHLTAAARDWLAANPSLVSGLGPDGWLMQVEPGWWGCVSSVDQVEAQLRARHGRWC